MEPKSTHKKAATHNRDTNKQPSTKKKDPKPKTPRSFPSLQNIPLYFEATGARGRRLRLAGLSICNRTAAGQSDVESLCPLWAPFRPSDDDESRNPTSVGSRGGWTNPNFNRWVNRSSGSWKSRRVTKN
jgi:hypothetical protein